MYLREALDQIAEIRRRMAESELFRGYRALPVALSGLYALLAGLLQPFVVPDPSRDVRGFVLLWTSVAATSVATAGSTMWMRDRLAGPSHTRAITWMAVRQFLPCLFSGFMATAVIVRLAPDAAWLLPGLWQLFFSQGIFASCRILPRPVFVAGLFYTVAGSASLLVFRESEALSPCSMALPFGVGQLMTASILYWTLERRDAVETES